MPGHLARCLALANYLEKLKAKVIFICRNHYGSSHELVLKQKFRLHLLNGKEDQEISLKHKDWLGFSQLQDVSESSILFTTSYQDLTLVAAVSKGHLLGFQFHPERSGASGLQLLSSSVKHLLSS